MRACKASLGNLQSGGESVNIPCRIGASTGAGNGREANKDWRLLTLCAQERSRSHVAIVAVASEGAMRTGPAGMNSPFGNLTALRDEVSEQALPSIFAFFFFKCTRSDCFD